MTGKILTIGIPAYKRKDALADVLQRALSGLGSADREKLCFLVIDDQSDDGTFEAASRFAEPGWVEVQRNAARAGFCGNFLNLIERCETEYLLIGNDDDFLDVAEIRRLLGALANASPAPAMVSTIFRDPAGGIYRGRETVQPIPVGEYRNCCNHLPGVVFNARIVQALLQRVGHLIRLPDNAYPQACIAFALLALDYPCVYWPFEPVATGFDLPSGLGAYASVEGRWRQYKMFITFFEAMLRIGRDERFIAVTQAVLEEHKRSLFRTLGNGVVNEFPELAGYYLNGAAGWEARNEAARV